MSNDFRGLVYIARENLLVMSVQQHDPATGITTDMDWSGVTRMVLRLYETSNGSIGDLVAVADTAEDATLIDYSENGKVTFKLGDILDVDDQIMTAQVCAMRLTAYEGAADTEIIHERSHNATIQFVSTG